MAHGNNRLAEQPRAQFQTAGGCIIKFRHPLLAGAIDTDSTGGGIDEIDISRCLKLEATFLSAAPNQDASSQTVLVDGSTVTITNHILNGTLTLPVIRTTGKVASGDFVAALTLIVASKDSVGGTLERTMFINGEAHTRLYYGVSVKRVPHDIIMGLQVPEFTCELYYTGFVDAISNSADVNLKQIWAVGSDAGIMGVYTPYEVNALGSTGTEPINLTNAPGQGTIEDDVTSAANLPVSDNPLEDITTYPYVRNPTQPHQG